MSVRDVNRDAWLIKKGAKKNVIQFFEVLKNNQNKRTKIKKEIKLLEKNKNSKKSLFQKKKFVTESAFSYSLID